MEPDYSGIFQLMLKMRAVVKRRPQNVPGIGVKINNPCGDLRELNDFYAAAIDFCGTYSLLAANTEGLFLWRAMRIIYPSCIEI